ncbi:hypothetical protein BC332_06594 [Capsicum chinense]|nr:hypothetical protein BC332_06594 [Capsicum chinense]
MDYSKDFFHLLHNIGRCYQTIDYTPKIFRHETSEIFDALRTMAYFTLIQLYLERIRVLWSYGWALPPIVLALLVTGGPKAFLMALAIPLGQSTFSFAIQKMLDTTQNKPTRKSKTKKRRRAAPTSSKANFWRRAGSSKTRKRKTGYQSWVPNNDVSASKDDREVSKYGGWDELDQETESKSSAQSSAETSKIPMEKGKLSSAEAKSDTPLLLRLLISMFPFLASWTKLL